MRARNYQFTINNYTRANLTRLATLSKSLSKHNYICYGLEVAPTTGTKHIQGYIQLTEQMGYKALHKYFNIKQNGKLVSFHAEAAKANAKKNIAYTSKTRSQDEKPNDVWLEYGEPKNQGGRSDITEIREKLRSNPKGYLDMLSNDDLNYQQSCYVERFAKYQFKHRDPKIPPKVFWIWGESGLGKTKKVYDEFSIENVHSVDDFQWLGENYLQQDVLLFDDLRAGDIKFNKLLKICDRYPVSLPVKGSHIALNSPYIIITSNKSIQETFDFEKHIEDVDQLQRRLIEVHFSEIESSTFKDFEPPEKKKKLKDKQMTLQDF